MSCNSYNNCGSGIFAYGSSWWWIIILIVAVVLLGGCSNGCGWNNGCGCGCNNCDNGCGC